MRKVIFIMLTLFLCFALPACSNEILFEPFDDAWQHYCNSTQIPAMKGLDLYVWKADSHFEFGILPGTNRLKTAEEVEGLKEYPLNLEHTKEYLGKYDKETYVGIIPLDTIFTAEEVESLKKEFNDLNMPNIMYIPDFKGYIKNDE